MGRPNLGTNPVNQFLDGFRPALYANAQGTGRSWDVRFNHVANRVNPAHFQTVVDMFVGQLGFVELRRTERAVWLRQPGANVDLQFSCSDTGHRDHDRERSQISFLSETPKADLERLASWFDARGLPAHVGAYSDREFYLDVPAAFVDFVVEAMLPELAAYELPLG
ncbi:hypothetical protein MKK63_11440 [Methylobacterium sp. J-088]|uniref:hypothetical protein n=1 Tax=Methylobacterium sp. J-088 TaxID=2836664 RepID=UPI001FBA535E|nr:hypothetical protein [Methylobacterium sp. J-088]MCJ2063322.1 hypothetical protein [Methylobacterium sp. J-088]